MNITQLSAVKAAICIFVCSLEFDKASERSVSLSSTFGVFGVLGLTDNAYASTSFCVHRE